MVLRDYVGCCVQDSTDLLAVQSLWTHIFVCSTLEISSYYVQLVLSVLIFFRCEYICDIYNSYFVVLACEFYQVCHSRAIFLLTNLSLGSEIYSYMNSHMITITLSNTRHCDFILLALHFYGIL